jgi:hypothetical protein
VSAGIHVIGLSRQQPMLTRLLPLMRADFYPFRQKPDGSWGGLFLDRRSDPRESGEEPRNGREPT